VERARGREIGRQGDIVEMRPGCASGIARPRTECWRAASDMLCPGLVASLSLRAATRRGDIMCVTE